MTLTLAIVSASVFAQGKVRFGNDDSHLVMSWGPDGEFVPVPQSGSGSVNMSLLTAELWGGTAQGLMTLQASFTNPGAIQLPDGRLADRNIVLTGIPAGTPAFFQVRIYGPGSAGLAGFSPVFTCVPGSFPYNSIVNSNSPSLSTWPPGPIIIGVCLGPCLGPVFRYPISQTVVRGANVSFSVGIAACPPTEHYQWLHNGVAILGATSSIYQIASAQPTDAGNYGVEVENICAGTRHSFEAAAGLTVLVPPTVPNPPSSQTAEIGAQVRLAVRAAGEPPLVYQWICNETNVLISATNPVLELDNVEFSRSGSYTVVVTNAGGAVTSTPAMLSVIPAVERRMVPALTLVGQPANALNLDAADVVAPGPNWAAFDSVLLTNSSQWYFDLSAPLPLQRFYRAWQTNVPNLPSKLDLHTVPAITLTGSIGSALRLDFLNQFGPTDAWSTLDTVTLINTTQLYFDTSAIGQPPRLWRIVPVP